PVLAHDQFSLAGMWDVEDQRAVADAGARLRLHFHARNVYLVLGGSDHVVVSVGGHQTRTISVDGDRLYTLYASSRSLDGLLELRFDRGVTAYAFTFG
ncbi:MAG: cytochrome c biogenesis protein DipZ, partial [Actinomycetota bacterium]